MPLKHIHTVGFVFVGSDVRKEIKRSEPVAAVGPALVLFFGRMREGERNLLGAFVELNHISFEEF